MQNLHDFVGFLVVYKSQIKYLSREQFKKVQVASSFSLGSLDPVIIRRWD